LDKPYAYRVIAGRIAAHVDANQDGEKMTSKITPTLPAPAFVAVANYFTANAKYHARFAAEAVADGDLDVAHKAASRAMADVAAFEQVIAAVTSVDLPTRTSKSETYDNR
jgi:hypothetical protein